ncbi:hypothetical protein CHS0354_037796 [Potamilus streckersoni]|uniref:Uncharacterized protein n=1 Tax=Potamilus streckersoni TaxID=2493646 RepID=A0AAE0SNN8_9BIVA|nr:hypothetical protein CHS0354_037796 [Potamilus streckersoni]
MLVWKRSTTRRYFWDLWTTRKQITSPTTFSPYFNFETTTRRYVWDLWSTSKLITKPSTPFLYPHFWSTTQSSHTENFAIVISASIGGLTSLAFLCCFITACVRFKRVQRRPVQEHQSQPKPQHHPSNTGILAVVIRRIPVQRCRISADTENLISNSQMNSSISQITAYAYNREPIAPVAPPPYCLASPSEPPPPYS